jgi:phage terminase large subunit-like protein
MKLQASPLAFFKRLRWLDGRPLLEAIEPYRQRIFTEALYTLNADGTPRYNRVLAGRGKKNWKSADLVLAGLYRFLAWKSSAGNPCAVIANDEDQADDDFEILKKLIGANRILAREVEVKQKEIVRCDGNGEFVVLPAKDVIGLHGKTFVFIGYDEIHGYRKYDVQEALALDPTRLDALEWITSYASIFNSPGAPLFDMVAAGKRGDDPRMYFSWYAADFATDRAFEGEDVTPEARANPSLASWGNPGYLAQQKRRLPSHKYRRLHLNLPGMPEGAYFDAERVAACVVEGRRSIKPQPGVHGVAFADMSGGSSDDATLGIAHADAATGRAVLDLVMSQTGAPPFNPRHAVEKFAATLKEYGIGRVVGDRYAGETFRQDFQDCGVSYEVSPLTKHQLYEALEPRINAGEVELLDVPRLQEQLLGLVGRGGKIDHLPGEHDDWINAAAGALGLLEAEVEITAANFVVGTRAAAIAARDERIAELGYAQDDFSPRWEAPWRDF